MSNFFKFNVFAVIQGIILFLSCCASCSVFEKCEENSLIWIRRKKKRDVFVSIIIGIVCGILLGGINFLLMRGNNPVVQTNVFKALITSLNPAILEEIANRCVFFAFCLSMAGGELTGKFQRFTGWCMMIVPHILPHMLFSMTNSIIESVLSWLISLVLYIIVFGFVFAFLQKKRDIASAMIAHGKLIGLDSVYLVYQCNGKFIRDFTQPNIIRNRHRLSKRCRFHLCLMFGVLSITRLSVLCTVKYI